MYIGYLSKTTSRCVVVLFTALRKYHSRGLLINLIDCLDSVDTWSLSSWVVVSIDAGCLSQLRVHEV